MKGIILLADFFEDAEALTTIDILRRAGLQIDMIGLQNKKITTQSNIVLECEYLLSDISYKDYDFLVIPGGKAVFKTLVNVDVIEEIIMYFYNSNKLVATICAAPFLPGTLGLFKNGYYTCFPGCDDGVEGINTGEGVVKFNNLITAKSMAYTTRFALEIIEYLLGSKVKERVENAIFGR